MEKLLPVSRRRRRLPPEELKSTEKPIRRWKYSRLRNNSDTPARALVRFPQIDEPLCLDQSPFFYFSTFSFRKATERALEFDASYPIA